MKKKLYSGLSIVLVVCLLACCLPLSAGAANRFSDVPDNQYYAEAVDWAVQAGVTAGTGGTSFTPNGRCTRAQIVTFLWRAAGKPVSSAEVSFTDVPAREYYAEAVRWAVENGITSGTSATAFSPNLSCTRAQAVTFLYRAAGEPEFSVSNQFRDVPDGAYYSHAVKWAVENGITTGTGNAQFSPNMSCTRAQIVTFLYRAQDIQNNNPLPEPELTREERIQEVVRFLKEEGTLSDNGKYVDTLKELSPGVSEYTCMTYYPQENVLGFCEGIIFEEDNSEILIFLDYDLGADYVSRCFCVYQEPEMDSEFYLTPHFRLNTVTNSQNDFGYTVDNAASLSYNQEKALIGMSNSATQQALYSWSVFLELLDSSLQDLGFSRYSKVGV